LGPNIFFLAKQSVHNPSTPNALLRLTNQPGSLEEPWIICLLDDGQFQLFKQGNIEYWSRNNEEDKNYFITIVIKDDTEAKEHKMNHVLLQGSLLHALATAQYLDYEGPLDQDATSAFRNAQFDNTILKSLKLKILNKNRKIDSAGLKDLFEIPLKTLNLNLSDNKDSKCTYELLSILASSTCAQHLTELTLSRIDNIDALKLLTSAHFPALTSLNISDQQNSRTSKSPTTRNSKLYSKKLKELLKLLPQTLQRLDISYVDLKDDHLKTFAQKVFPELTYLNIKGNHSLTSKGIKSLIQGHFPKLKHLVAGEDTLITREEVEEDIESLLTHLSTEFPELHIDFTNTGVNGNHAIQKACNHFKHNLSIKY
jgi:hypothetical protein